ncbi:MAG: hypothetical protein ACFFCW_43275 [Candidatus Hodarchaeota archaeon]
MIGFLSTSLVYVTIIGGIKIYKKVRDRLHEAVNRKRVRQWGAFADYSDTLLTRTWGEIRRVGFLPWWLVPLLFIIFWAKMW